MGKSAIIFPLLLLVMSGCIYVDVQLPQGPAPAQEKVVEGKGRAKIVLLDLGGRLMRDSALLGRISQKPSVLARFKEELDLAAGDPDVVGAVVRIDSPGGSVTVSDILFHEIRSFRESK